MTSRPTCPRSVGQGRWRNVWRSLLAELQAQGTWRASDAILLERLVLNLRTASEALAEAQVEPWITGSTGQQVAHPGFAVAARCDALAQQQARQLGLTPAGRAGRGISGDGEERIDVFSRIDDLASRRAAAALPRQAGEGR